MPKRFRVGILTAIVVLAGVVPSHAEYPYSGFWDNPDAETPPRDVARRCALTFVKQRADGRYDSYVLDREAFGSRNEVIYRRYASGNCTVEPLTNLESCHSVLDLTDTSGQTYTLYDVLTTISPDRVEFVAFDTLSEARAAIAEDAVEDTGSPGAFVRCPIPADTLSAHLSSDLSTANENDLMTLTNPDDDTLRGGLADAVLQALGVR